MLTTGTTSRRRLLLQVTAVLALLLLIGFTVLMHSMASDSSDHQHTMVSSSTATVEQHGAEHANTTAVSFGPVVTMLTDASCDGGLCALMCAVMGMACALAIAVFAWALLRGRSGGTLFVLARLLALADRVARRVAMPKPPSLTALQIIRI